jgi:hypothetical protein
LMPTGRVTLSDLGRLKTRIGGDNRPMRFDLWNCKSLDAARLRDVVYYFSAGFSNLQARELEGVPFSTGHRCEHVIRCGPGATGSWNLALANTHSEWEVIGRLWRFGIRRD